MPRLRLVLVGAALAAVCLAGMVSAATMQAIYRGTVSSGVDGAGLFGAGQDLTGLGFKAVFIYDTDTPGATRETTPNSDVIFGGTGPGGTSPMRSASLTINKHTQFVHPQFLGSILTERSAISHNGVFLSPDKADQVAAIADSSAFLFPTSLDTPVSAAALTPIGGGILLLQLERVPCADRWQSRPQVAAHRAHSLARHGAVARVGPRRLRVLRVPVPCWGAPGRLRGRAPQGAAAESTKSPTSCQTRGAWRSRKSQCQPSG